MEIQSEFKYQAFLSYAHADEAIASRLHKALEAFAVPKSLSAKFPNGLKPIFRDTTELTAHHDLSEKIREAVLASKFLIVLCSPAAKISHWVNEEIRLFRRLHGEASILCCLLEGTPDICFPGALTDGGREPLAADLSQNNFRLGTTQIAASMLGVGLDDLIQRDLTRRRRRLQVVTLSAIAFSAVMGVTAFTAVEARNDAIENRAQAEDLVEYMITDLKTKLEPVGRLDVLDGVGDKVIDYYNSQDATKMSDDSLARQARARHILAQVALDAGRTEEAIREVTAARALTRQVLDRNPEDLNTIFTHAQSEYWVGAFHYVEKQYDAARPYWKQYQLLAQRLYKTDSSNKKWIMEAGYGANNMALLARRTEAYVEASTEYKTSIAYFEKAMDIDPTDRMIQQELANALAGASRTSASMGDKIAALNYRRRQIGIYEKQFESQANDYQIRFRRAQAYSSLIERELIIDESLELDSAIKFLESEYELLLKYDPMNQNWKKAYVLYLNKLAELTADHKIDVVSLSDIKLRLAQLGSN